MRPIVLTPVDESDLLPPSGSFCAIRINSSVYSLFTSKVYLDKFRPIIPQLAPLKKLKRRLKTSLAVNGCILINIFRQPMSYRTRNSYRNISKSYLFC